MRYTHDNAGPSRWRGLATVVLLAFLAYISRGGDVASIAVIVCAVIGAAVLYPRELQRALEQLRRPPRGPGGRPPLAPGGK